MWNISGFQMPGYRLDMYPADHFPHHFHLSCAEFDVRILYRQSDEDGVIHLTVVWCKNWRKKDKLLNAQEERTLLALINQFFDRLGVCLRNRIAKDRLWGVKAA
jgi:hypothetical protein